MDGVTDIKIGQSFTPDEWFAARDRLGYTSTVVARIIVDMNNRGAGEIAASRFMVDAQMAMAAMDFVGRYASENCRYIPAVYPTGDK